MITRIFLKNFQAHLKKVIKLTKVTVFLGPSDSGKSSVMRAIRWVCLNQPRGGDFVSHGESNCLAALETESGRVTRKRSKGSNRYSVNGKGYSAVGSGIPEEVQKALNLGPVNFQSQMDSPFWFSLTPGEVAKELNSIVNLSDIDSAFAVVNAELRQARSAESVVEQRLDKALQKKKQLAWVAPCNDSLRSLEVLQSFIDASASRIASVATLVEEAATLSKEAQTASGIATDGSELIGKAKTLFNDSAKVKSLEELLISLKSIKIVEIPELDESTYSELLETRKRMKALIRDISSLNLAEKELCQAQESLKESKEKLKTKTGGSCPVCGGVLSTESL